MLRREATASEQKLVLQPGESGSFAAGTVTLTNKADSAGVLCAEYDPVAPYVIVTFAEGANGCAEGLVATDKVVIGDGCDAVVSISGGLVSIGDRSDVIVKNPGKSENSDPPTSVETPDGSDTVGAGESKTFNT